MGKQKLQI